jgi:hypothetical protein
VSQELTLSKKSSQAAVDPLSYEALRAEGLRLVQAYSGGVWTDYNAHDPGITLLESMCFALTDAVYRTSFDMDTYLCDPTGRIDLGKLGLERSNAVLRTAEVTLGDLQCSLLSDHPWLAGVWIEWQEGITRNGGMRIFCQTDAVPRADVPSNPIQVLTDWLAGRRNWGEGATEVLMLAPQPVQLTGHIDCERSFDPVQVLAQCYAACHSYACSRPTVRPRIPTDVRALDMPGDRDFSTLEAIEYAPRRHTLDVLEILKVIRAVPGIKSVSGFSLTEENGQPETSVKLQAGDGSGERYFHLIFPWETAHRSPGIRLTCGAQAHTVESSAVQVAYERLLTQDRALISDSFTRTTLPELYATWRALADYTPIHQHLPQHYGLGDFGTSDFAPAMRMAQAAQLRGYLGMFDQLLANAMAQLTHARDILGVPDVKRPTHYAHPAPHGKSLRRRDAFDPQSPAQLALNSYDDADGRRERMLDLLLALQGETLEVRRFGPNSAPPVGERVRLKTLFLAELAQLSHCRATAVDSKAVGGEQLSATARKIHFRLGFGIDTGLGNKNQLSPIRLIDAFAIDPDGLLSESSLAIYCIADRSVWQSDPEAMAWAEQVVREEIPVHLLLHMRWLEPPVFADGAALVDAWANTVGGKSGPGGHVEATRLCAYLRQVSGAGD